MGIQSHASVKPVEQSPYHDRRRRSGSLKALENSYPSTPLPVVVQGRKGGPLESHRVASRRVCLAAKILGWVAVIVGAAEFAVGVVVFDVWQHEGGWWAGVLGLVVGALATGINADTPVGTRMFSWLVWMSLVTVVASLATLLALDGQRWLDTKDFDRCEQSSAGECPASRCVCTKSGQGNICVDFDQCSDLVQSNEALLASSCALLVLAADSALLFVLGVKCRYFGGGVMHGGNRQHPHPLPSFRGGGKGRASRRPPKPSNSSSDDARLVP